MYKRQALENIVDGAAPYPGTISISYGESESQNGATQNAMYNSTYENGAAEGISIFVSSGDEGPCSSNADGADCTRGITVSGFASTPYNISVGGTDFGDAYAGTESTYWSATNTPSYGSALKYVPEIPWNDACGSVLIAEYSHASFTTYGSTGFCNVSPYDTTSEMCIRDRLNTVPEVLDEEQTVPPLDVCGGCSVLRFNFSGSA